MSDEKTKHAGGRPRKYESPEQMQAAIDEYFTTDTQPTVTGLAIALGFTSRNALYVYEGYSEEYFGTLKVARLRVEHEYEKALRVKGIHAAGPIFALKNLGWKDTQTVSVEQLPPITVTIMRAEDGLKAIQPNDEH
jgi:hypothetical protein